ncbi:MAG: hypothetical protein EHM51_00075 [Geobacter sp.]|nr:MAG: hypothetical protein EHM51_00075 [Geobacter sp.]
MNRKPYRIALPSTAIVMMMACASMFFLTCANPSFAATGKKKPTTVERTSAVDHTEGRIKLLGGALKVTEDQQVLWNNLTQVMRENAKELDTMSKDKSEITKTMNALEAMKFHSQITEFRLEQQKKLIPTFEAFYTSMSDEQKKVADTIFRTGRHGKQKIN